LFQGFIKSGQSTSFEKLKLELNGVCHNRFALTNFQLDLFTSTSSLIVSKFVVFSFDIQGWKQSGFEEPTRCKIEIFKRLNVKTKLLLIEKAEVKSFKKNLLSVILHLKSFQGSEKFVSNTCSNSFKFDSIEV
jgi:hypothetical protein